MSRKIQKGRSPGLKTSEGKKLYAKRKSTVEPALGVIKHVMGFRQFLLRGIEVVRMESGVLVGIFKNGSRFLTAHSCINQGKKGKLKERILKGIAEINADPIPNS